MNNYAQIIATVLATLIFTAPVVHGTEDSVEELFLKANQSFKSERYEEAIRLYETLIQRDGKNGHVFYNLGNAYFRMNNLGKAILSYERARIFLPRDADLDFNLRYARDQLQDAVARTQSFVGMVFFWLDSFSPLEIFWAFAVIHLLFWGVLLLRLFYKSEWGFYLLLTTCGLWLVLGISFGLKWYQVNNDPRAFVVADEVNVLAGPSEGDTVLFKLHAGTMTIFERAEDGWALIHLPDKKRGWVPTDMVETVSSTLGDTA